jgi:hypothetical protein
MNETSQHSEKRTAIYEKFNHSLQGLLFFLFLSHSPISSFFKAFSFSEISVYFSIFLSVHIERKEKETTTMGEK